MDSTRNVDEQRKWAEAPAGLREAKEGVESEYPGLMESMVVREVRYRIKTDPGGIESVKTRGPLLIEYVQ